MTRQIFAEDYKAEPFWWERSPRPDTAQVQLPAKADVVIIGSGYTGLHAAIQTARAGRHTVVIDAEAAGWGCSSRNGGQISTSIKPSYGALKAKFGADAAFAIRKEGLNALQWVEDFTTAEGIDCDFRRVGRFYAAHTPGNYEALARSFDHEVKGLETGAYAVPKTEQHREIASDLYHGGVVQPLHASIDPGAYHLGLLDRAQAAGAEIVPHCRAEGIEGAPGTLTVRTSKGEIAARNVVVATSGYTGGATPWHRRRIIPIGSYMIATDRLAPDLVARLIPNDRVITDTRKLVVYYRTCPERRRILFGGRVSISETDPSAAAPDLHAEMVRRFPELSEAKVSHAWMGFVGYTFDELPHLGEREGVHYAMGYCGSGVSLASYLGMRIGQQLLGLAEGESPLADVPFETRAYYWGKPWFLAPSISYYRWRDNRAA
ncbi:MAG: FAD-binding oxidoreductase [Pseudomonadota bacterium]